MLGAAYLLFEGGRSLDAQELRAGWRSTLLLATIGVLITTAVVAAAAHLAFGLAAAPSLLLGAVLSPTDPAAIIPVLTALPVSRRIEALLVAESAANDATGAALAAALAGSGPNVATGLGSLAWNLALGLGVGGLVGLALHALQGRLRESQHGLRPLIGLAAMVVAYALATAAAASGFLAAFVAGLLAGRSHRRLRSRDPVAASFYEYSAGIFGRLTRIIVFTLLGASLVPSLLWRLALPALIVTLALVLVARPLTVLLLGFGRARYPWREIAFAAWVRETGVVPGALAALLLARHAAGGSVVAACVFMALIITLLGQAPTTRFVAARLGLLRRPGTA
jgi:cell volume regulation protein A